MTSLQIVFLVVGTCFLTTCNDVKWDPLHPVFHFAPPSMWMNDPNGLVYYNGVYHLFYQYNPKAAYWGDMHWGHAVSYDLINWIWLPIALAPSEAYDMQGIFSGSMSFNDEGTPVALYTGQTNSTEQQCVAFPANLEDPFLIEWTKYPGNPVIMEPNNTGGFRDPTTAWTIKGYHYILVGSSLDSLSCVYQWRSKDYLSWELVNIMLNSSNPASSVVWECPDMYNIEGEIWVLKHSDPDTRDYWITGYYDEESYSFIPITRGVLDFGTHYASKRFDANGRTISFGWVRDTDDCSFQIKRGWASIQTVPREVTLGDDGILRFNPIVELEQLRTSAMPISVVVYQNAPNQNLNVYGAQLDIVANITGFDETSVFGFIVANSEENDEQTSITFKNYMYLQDMLLTGDTYMSSAASSSIMCDETCAQDNFCMAWSYLSGSCLFFADFNPVSFVPGAISFWKPMVVANTFVSSTDDQSQSIYYAPWDPMERPLNVRIIYDRSVVELFVNNGKSVLTFRVYPSTVATLQGLEVFGEGDKPISFDMQIFEMAPASFTTYNATKQEKP